MVDTGSDCIIVLCKPALFRLFAAVRTPVPVSNAAWDSLDTSYLRGNRDDFGAFHFQNLLVVGPGVLIFRDYTKIKTGTRPV